jgi:hypothetical protein
MAETSLTLVHVTTNWICHITPPFWLAVALKRCVIHHYQGRRSRPGHPPRPSTTGSTVLAALDALGWLGGNPVTCVVSTLSSTLGTSQDLCCSQPI